MNPDVMLFDEVTAALDPETVKDVLVTIRELAEDGMTCMIVTHEMGFAREVANQVYFTDGGVLVEHGPPKEFFANPRDPRTRQFLDQILYPVPRAVQRRSPHGAERNAGTGPGFRCASSGLRQPQGRQFSPAFRSSCRISAPQRSVSFLM